MPNHADPRELLEHEDFVRALARRILIHDDRVDDAVQETWLRALQRGPTNLSALRSWLATVVRNFSKQRLRTDSRHDARLRSAQGPPHVPTPAEILEREALRRRVVEAVLELHEPYRSAILLRFFEELESEEVAERLGIPVETARTRIKRGLAQLRQRLAKGIGGDWRAALVPLLGREVHGTMATTSTASWLGILIMSTKAKVAAGLAVAMVVAGGYWISDQRGTESDVADRETGGPTALETAAVELATAMTEQAAQPGLEELPPETLAEAAVEDQERSPTGVAEDPVPEPNLIVAVATEEGEPVPDAVVEVARLLPDADFDPTEDRGIFELVEAEAKTAANGRATLELSSGRFSLSVAKPGFFAWRQECPIRSDPVEVEFRLARTTSIQGRVLDGADDAIEGAHVRLLFEVRVGESLRHWDIWKSTMTDGRGRFRIGDIPVFSEAVYRLRVLSPGFLRPLSEALELTKAEPLDVGDLHLRYPGATVRGIVVDAMDAPVPGAKLIAEETVRVGSWRRLRGKSDGGGAFEISGLSAGPYQLDVFSTLRGRAVCEFEVAEGAELDLGRVVLEPARHVARGYVVDVYGRPLESATVSSTGRSATTDATGYFELAVESAGPLAISLEWHPMDEPSAVIRSTFEGIQLSAASLELPLRPCGLRFDFYDASTRHRTRTPSCGIGWKTAEGRSTSTRFMPEGGSMLRLPLNELRSAPHEVLIGAEGFHPTQVDVEVPEHLDREIVVPVYLTRR